MEEDKLKFIYWFAYYNHASPSVRYRAIYPLEYFRKEKGINNYLVFPGYTPKHIYQFLKIYLSALLFRKQNSLIVIQRVRSKFIYATLLKFLIVVHKKNTVYDLDDADYLEGDPGTIYFFSKHCDKISAGSSEIVNHLQKFNSDVFHITSPVANLNIVKKHKSSVFTIGWVGAFGGDHKSTMIDIVFPALKLLTFEFRFILLGVTLYDDILFIRNYFIRNKNIHLELPENVNWNDEISIQKIIYGFDLGLATLSNTPMQLSKSGIQAKQYLNNGVPVLSTDLPENNSVVIDGFNGFLCTTTQDFYNGIIKFFLMTEEQYRAFSTNARNSTINFDHNYYFESFKNIYSGNRNKFHTVERKSGILVP